jgi:hypothetical protein
MKCPKCEEGDLYNSGLHWECDYCEYTSAIKCKEDYRDTNDDEDEELFDNSNVFKVTVYDKNDNIIGNYTTVAEDESIVEEEFTKMQSEGIYDDGMYCEIEVIF